MTNYPRITEVARAMPQRRIEQWMVKFWSEQRFSNQLEDTDRLLEVFDNAGIKTRHFCMDPGWYMREQDFEAKNNAYIEHAVSLSTKAIKSVLKKSKLNVSDIDYLIFVSSTGLATPSIDARILGSMGFDSHIRRTPIWGLGCAGGAAGLSHAYHHLLGHPRERVLVISLELCSLTFHFSDYSKSNFVATALFGDGCSAAVLSGSETEDRRGPQILASQSTLWPDSLDVMGWNVLNEGMQVVFSKAIPVVVMRKARENIEGFLKEHDFSLKDLDHFIAHPGGTKVLEAYERALKLPKEIFSDSYSVLRKCGNVSSVTVMLVLEEVLRSQKASAGELGLLTALGPGFSSEHLLLRF
jgi:alkylresorcinol/alkylpyrone synthase